MRDLTRTRAHLETGLRENHWTGYAVAVRSAACGTDLAGGDVADPSVSVPWFSAGKPVTAVGVLRMTDSSPDLLTQPLSRSLPELESSYAGTLTLEQILSHQTGLRVPETRLTGETSAVWEFFRNVTPADANLSPGQAAYDPAGGWWLLGQWLGRRTGRPWAEFLEEDLLRPAGLPGLKFGAPVVTMRERRAGRWAGVGAGSGPGAALVGPAGEMARFYEKLWQGDLLSAAARDRLLFPARRSRLDATFGHIVDFGLGVILNSNRHGATTVPYGFGTRAGARAFGHGGARSSIAFADPDHNFTAALFLNGRVPETEHQPRMRALLDLLRSELV